MIYQTMTKIYFTANKFLEEESGSMDKKIYLFMLSAFGFVISINKNPLYGQDSGSPLFYYAGNTAQLSVAKVTDHAFEIVLAPLESATAETPAALPETDWNYPRQLLFEGRSLMDPMHGRTGEYAIDILRSPLRVVFRDIDQHVIQEISWPDNGGGKLEFRSDTPLPGFNFNVEEDSNNQPVLAVGEKQWAILFQYPRSPENQYYYDGGKGVFIPDPAETKSPMKLFLILWEHRDQFFEEYRTITGRSSLPHVWREEVAEVD